MEPNEIGAWLRLTTTEGIGCAHGLRLLRAFGLPENAFAQDFAALAAVVGERLALALTQKPDRWEQRVHTTCAWLAQRPNHHRLLPLGSPHYPQSLLALDDPPLLLYAIAAPKVWDHPELLADIGAHAIAVVGSRNPSQQGAENAQAFATALAQAGLTVVSGLARGIDGAAHQGALDARPAPELATIAVVGTGLDRVYPRQHLRLAHDITQAGALLSEYALGTAALASNFPRRNRLIAGLSRATLVVEAAVQSGSLITARLACEQGKDVFAIPGSIHNPQARGCHVLIKQGAQLVEQVSDVLDALSMESAPARGGVQPQASTADDAVLKALGYDAAGLDALLARTGMDVGTLQVRLMELELSGDVRRQGGGYWQRVVRA